MDCNLGRCEIETEALVERIKQILEDKKANDLVVLDVRERSTMTDWLVVASGMSKPHVKALYEDVLVRLKHEGVPCYRHAGGVEGGWLVLDYLNVVVHVFTPEMRAFYQIEDLWKGDGPAAQKLAVAESEGAALANEDDSATESKSARASRQAKSESSRKKQSSRPSAKKVFESVSARVKTGSTVKRKSSGKKST